MDWIEQLFGFSPDGGDGTTEVMMVFAACVLIGIVIYARVPKVKAYVRSLLGLKLRT
ncbi:MAG: hypothetical protein QOJ84_4253 [Bradyrhizobium sp.]|jgi:hypothetical protein|nr:hypothetical protein [Bradyrhizobium sp.]